MRAYLFLSISIIFEVFGTTMLKLSEGFTVLWPSLAVVIGYGISFFFLGLTLKTMALSLAYAIWAGAGTALTVVISVLLWDEVLNVLKIIALLLIITGIILLNTSHSGKKNTAAEGYDYN